MTKRKTVAPDDAASLGFQSAHKVCLCAEDPLGLCYEKPCLQWKRETCCFLGSSWPGSRNLASVVQTCARYFGSCSYQTPVFLNFWQIGGGKKFNFFGFSRLFCQHCDSGPGRRCPATHPRGPSPEAPRAGPGEASQIAKKLRRKFGRPLPNRSSRLVLKTSSRVLSKTLS